MECPLSGLIQYFCVFPKGGVDILHTDDIYMRRCLELARLGAGHTAPNPMVGSVLVFEDRIIGEGYHMQYGQAHAEVNCIRSVRPEDQQYISRSTIYVSLEPCAHYGKTPPCADLIIEKKIPRAVIGCRDPFEAVNGKGIEKMLAAGITVLTGVLEQECVALNKRFFTFHTRYRPYIVLKWAQSANGRIGAGPVTGASGMSAGDGAVGRPLGGEPLAKRTLISNEFTNRLVHKWRSEEASILVGTRTALMDDPALTARLWNGPDPIRLVIDKTLSLPSSLKVFDGKVRTIIFNNHRHEMDASASENLLYYQLATDSSLIQQLVVALYRENIQSVLVEGGARLLQSFIDEGYWDETRVITNEALLIPEGLRSPELPDCKLASRERLFSDSISYYLPNG